ncbi:hypothetical protein [Selenomonas ruminantium]|uniref:hypothetical protein n=1 Tax=Selenomonas ruminantium TaxID=971 RepID=UPI000563F608|nr:hypothetical protein [Selenomonas ruminantium]
MDNGEHYNDPTAQKAIANINRDERRARVRRACAKARAVLRHEGFDVMGRIALIDLKTGKRIL